MRAVVAALGAALTSWCVGAVAKATLEPHEILDARQRLYATAYAWSDQRQRMRVTTVDARGGRQERTIELYERRYVDGSRKTLLVFRAPDNVKGTAVLSQERVGGARERWLYLPRQQRARRFAGAMHDEALMGTDLTAGEIDLIRETLGWSGASVHAVSRGTRRIDDADAYGLEVATTRGYQRIVLWVGTGDLVMRQLELYGADAAIVKRIRQSDVRFVGTVPVPLRLEAENPKAGTRSVFDVLEVALDTGFPDDVFSLPLLASPAKE
jgi:hypothetical protein